MGLYSKYIFPRLLNLGMSGKHLAAYRAQLLQHARGRVLELGFGTGLNLPYYPSHIQQLHAVEVNEGMRQLALKHIDRGTIEVRFHWLNAEQLPFEAEAFDTVVSTWTLCSIAAIDQALAQVHRVLHPQGQFLFLEHGLSHELAIQQWQRRLTPFQKVMADGCHLDRDMEALVRKAGFDFWQLRKEYAMGSSKVAGYLYIGIAAKSPAGS